jgi:CDP-4-dehydro-6-deoxyglucose reductase
MDNILSSALKTKINLPHGCKNGTCGACKCKKVTGSITYQEEASLLLSPEELADNYVLLCKAHASSDITLSIPEFKNKLPIKVLPSKIETLTKLGSVAILELRLPASQNFVYYPGQYIDILYNGSRRSYSIANYTDGSGRIELHIRYQKGGFFSEIVWNKLATQQILRFEGPLGSFKISDSQSPIIMACTGTGFAPIKAILEEMAATNSQREVKLIWGNYTVSDFYNLELLEKWRANLNFSWELCTSNEKAEGFYSGFITTYIKENYPNLNQYEMYTCGNSNMIDNLKELSITKLGLIQQNFFCDIFTPSAT